MRFENIVEYQVDDQVVGQYYQCFVQIIEYQYLQDWWNGCQYGIDIGNIVKCEGQQFLYKGEVYIQQYQYVLDYQVGDQVYCSFQYQIM